LAVLTETGFEIVDEEPEFIAAAADDLAGGAKGKVLIVGAEAADGAAQLAVAETDSAVTIDILKEADTVEVGILCATAIRLKDDAFDIDILNRTGRQLDLEDAGIGRADGDVAGRGTDGPETGDE
jgi:hypothetical protein